MSFITKFQQVLLSSEVSSTLKEKSCDSSS
ncbi:MAG: hypothetical protein KDK36_10370 [Leptospiraceae bacterium]|nr:hypothetical protein [Leptospiraceae bacterium]